MWFLSWLWFGVRFLNSVMTLVMTKGDGYECDWGLIMTRAMGYDYSYGNGYGQDKNYGLWV